MKILRTVCGLVLLLVASTGALGCLLSSAALKSMVVEGTPVTCPYRGTQFKLPGRLVGAVMIGIPTVAFVSGAWLLVSGVRRDDERNA